MDLIRRVTSIKTKIYIQKQNLQNKLVYLKFLGGNRRPEILLFFN